VAIAEGVMKAMLKTRVILVAALVALLALVGAGIGALAHDGKADGQAQEPDAGLVQQPQRDKKGPPKEGDAADLQRRVAALEKERKALSSEVEVLRKEAKAAPARPADKAAEIFIYTLRNADARKLAKVLDELLNPSSGDKQAPKKMAFAVYE